ncbi:MAG TPA: hypothetical protein VK983_05765 [Candidatus Limnocylindrales bacterium]|nr:hypothetical protein [Candidatus Limnocylindrales bacterium]
MGIHADEGIFVAYERLRAHAVPDYLYVELGRRVVETLRRPINPAHMPVLEHAHQPMEIPEDPDWPYTPEVGEGL